MADITIRSYQGSDEAGLLRLWNLALTHDPIDEVSFHTRVLLDLNFNPEGLFLAEAGGQLVGFVLSLNRQVPQYLQGLEPELGWITAFGVHPAHRRKKVATRLFDAALYRLHREQVLISPYTPNYFTPGVDRLAYPAAIAFLEGTGWEAISNPISMRAELTGLQIPEDMIRLENQLAKEYAITIQPVASTDLPELISFIAGNFGWDWVRAAQECLLEVFGPGSDEICFLVAKRAGRIVGYCQQRRERFGPFGVAPDLRGLGIGKLLLFHCLASMLARGFHCAWFLWTGSNAARLYSLAGFHVVRQFVVMRRLMRIPNAEERGFHD